MNIELPPTIFHDLVLLLIDRLKIVQNRFAKTTKSVLMYVNLVKKIWRGKSVCLNLLFVHEFIAGWWRRNSYQSWNKSSCIVFFFIHAAVWGSLGARQLEFFEWMHYFSFDKCGGFSPNTGSIYMHSSKMHTIST